MFRRGVLILGAGQNAIRLAPPLVLTKDQAETLLRDPRRGADRGHASARRCWFAVERSGTSLSRRQAIVGGSLSTSDRETRQLERQGGPAGSDCADDQRPPVGSQPGGGRPRAP